MIRIFRFPGWGSSDGLGCESLMVAISLRFYLRYKSRLVFSEGELRTFIFIYKSSRLKTKSDNNNIALVVAGTGVARIKFGGGGALTHKNDTNRQKLGVEINGYGRR